MDVPRSIHQHFVLCGHPPSASPSGPICSCLIHSSNKLWGLAFSSPVSEKQQVGREEGVFSLTGMQPSVRREPENMITRRGGNFKQIQPALQKQVGEKQPESPRGPAGSRHHVIEALTSMMRN